MHYQNMCQYGYVHGQCRCPDRNKRINFITCDQEENHRLWFVVAYDYRKRRTIADAKKFIIGIEDLLPNFKTMKEAIDFARSESNANGFQYHVFRMPKIGKK